jgi:hypothetical protein
LDELLEMLEKDLTSSCGTGFIATKCWSGSGMVQLIGLVVIRFDRIGGDSIGLFCSYYFASV